MNNLFEMRNDIDPVQELETAKFLDDMTSNFAEVFGIYGVDGMDSWQALCLLFKAGGQLDQKSMLVEKMDNINTGESKKYKAIKSLENHELVKTELNNAHVKGAHKIFLTDKGNKAILSFHQNVRSVVSKYQEVLLK